MQYNEVPFKWWQQKTSIVTQTIKNCLVNDGTSPIYVYIYIYIRSCINIYIYTQHQAYLSIYSLEHVQINPNQIFDFWNIRYPILDQSTPNRECHLLNHLGPFEFLGQPWKWASPKISIEFGFLPMNQLRTGGSLICGFPFWDTLPLPQEPPHPKPPSWQA